MSRHLNYAYIEDDGTLWYYDCPECHFFKNATAGPCRQVGCSGTVVKVFPQWHTLDLAVNAWLKFFGLRAGEYSDCETPEERMEWYVDENLPVVLIEAIERHYSA